MSMRGQLPGRDAPREVIEAVPTRGSMSKQLPRQDSRTDSREYIYVTPTDSAIDLAAHIDATDPHPDLIDDLTAITAVVLTDTLIVSQGGTNRRVTVAQLRAIVNGTYITPNTGSLAYTGKVPTVT